MAFQPLIFTREFGALIVGFDITNEPIVIGSGYAQRGKYQAHVGEELDLIGTFEDEIQWATLW